jgi:cytochrome P450
VRGYAEAHAVLQSDAKQAGFNIELIAKLPKTFEWPVLFQDGPAHREQRSQIARFFTPTTTEQRHLATIERYVDESIAAFTRAGSADVIAMTGQLAMNVAADVVGLTESPRGPMKRRLDHILHAEFDFRVSPVKILSWLGVQWQVLMFLLLDVMPSIKARRKVPGEDVISYMIGKGRKPGEILTECITYGTAGMVTTQEFIAVCLWHAMRNPAVKEVLMSDDREIRYRFLHELLRVEPVVRTLWRRASGALTIESEGATVEIPGGSLIALHVDAINRDATVTGEAPLEIRKGRVVPRGVSASVLSFGQGPHRCAGEHIAIAEADAFLNKFLRIPGLRVLSEPCVAQNPLIESYEIKDFRIGLT